MKVNYSVPKLVRGKSRWYAKFFYYGKEYRITDDINRIKDLKEKEFAGEILCAALLTALKNGWNPVAEVHKPAYAVDDSFANSMSLLSALDFALEKKKPKVASKTYQDYKGTVKFCQEAIHELGYQLLPITQTKRIHIKNILEQVKETRKWSASAYNKNLGYLQGVMSELLKWYIIETNPAHLQETYTEDDREPTRTPTPEEYRIIKKTLKTAHFDYYRYILALFHSGIRPEEMTEVKLSDIDMVKREFKLKPLYTKTKKFRTVAMPLELYEFLCDMELDQHPDNFYLFGTFKKSDKRYLPHTKEFVPAPYKITRSRATRLWKQYVKDGLGIDVNMYCGKHAGANAMYQSGISKEAIKKKFGHNSMFSTEIYLTELNGSLLDEIKRSNIRFDED